MTRAIRTGHCASTVVRTARRTYYCGGCTKGTAIQPGDRHLEHTEYPGGESGYADSAGHPVRMRECAPCAHKCGRGNILDETGRETTAFQVLDVVLAWAGSSDRARRAGTETMAEAAERLIRVYAEAAESSNYAGRSVTAALAEIHLLDDYLRIKRADQAAAPATRGEKQ